MAGTNSQENLITWQLEIIIRFSKTFVICNSTLKCERYKTVELYIRLVQNLKPENVPAFLSLFFKKSMWINYKVLIDLD